MSNDTATEIPQYPRGNGAIAFDLLKLRLEHQQALLKACLTSTALFLAAYGAVLTLTFDPGSKPQTRVVGAIALWVLSVIAIRAAGQAESADRRGRVHIVQLRRAVERNAAGLDLRNWGLRSGQLSLRFTLRSAKQAAYWSLVIDAIAVALALNSNSPAG